MIVLLSLRSRTSAAFNLTFSLHDYLGVNVCIGVKKTNVHEKKNHTRTADSHYLEGQPTWLVLSSDRCAGKRRLRAQKGEPPGCYDNNYDTVVLLIRGQGVAPTSGCDTGFLKIACMIAVETFAWAVTV